MAMTLKPATAKRTKRTGPLSVSIAQRAAAARAKKAAEKKATAAPTPKKAAPAARAPAPAAAPDGRRITVLAPTNPKRPGSAAHARFALYRTGMTVAEFVAAGGRAVDLNWDVPHKFIRVDPAA